MTLGAWNRRGRVALFVAALALAGCQSQPVATVARSGGGTTPAVKPATMPYVVPPAPVVASPGVMEEAASKRSPVIGKMATDFTLPEVRASSFTLSAERGKWVVLYFYPQADTPGCTCQATEFTNLLAKFSALDAEVVGVAPDSASAIEFFADKYKLQIRLLSDERKTVMRQYGAWVDQTVAGQQMGRVVRSTFLIDPAGKIAWHWPEVIPEGHAERVRLRLEAIRGLRQ